MPTAIVSGALADKAGLGGAAWVRLSYVLGLRRLGWDVFVLEELSPEAPLRWSTAGELKHVAYFRDVVEAFGLAGRAGLIGGDRAWGLTLAELRAVAAEADVLVNVGGNLRRPDVKALPRRRVYVDLDPGYTQHWLATGVGNLGVEGHDVHFTVGANVGTPSCPIPHAGIVWRHTLPPVVLDDWPVPVEVDAEPDRFTTVASWRGPYGPILDGGRAYGPKVHQFRRFVELPERFPATFEIALDIHPADHEDRDLLQRRGWRLVRPERVAPGPLEFRRYVQGSWAEFSVAQGIYVETGSGWFSDRTTRYLASGRPALVQDTGFSQTLPAGEGLLAFRTFEEAVAGAEEIAADYGRHAKAARALAEEHFDSDRVLTALLEEAGV